ncbi:MAG: sugar kinase [Polyangiaceae bacterium]|nr:sugar kinase [Polyangiaceae bacterium]
MILSRAPVRFSLGGGGTDLPSYSKVHGGFLVASAIDKYVFIAIHKRFDELIRLSYSKTELVNAVSEIEHPIFREALQLAKVEKGIELFSMADVPANSGLGSSSTFTVALLNALHAYKREYLSTGDLAEAACSLEIDRLKEPIGKQDQYIAAYGGVTAFTFNKDGTVVAERVNVAPETLDELESNLLIFFSGVERRASSVLKEQAKTITANADDAVNRMHRIKEMGYETKRYLERGEVDKFGDLLHEHWMNKRQLASNMSDSNLDEHYEAARKAGAIGGKIMGAGGGGFFMFYTRPGDKRRVYEAMKARGLRQLRFRFDHDGARIQLNVHTS